MNEQYGITCRNLTTSFFDFLDNINDFGTLDIIRFGMFNDGGFHPHIQEFFPELVPIQDTNNYGDNNGSFFRCSETASTIAMTRYDNTVTNVNVYAILPFTYHLDNYIGDGRGIPRAEYDDYMNNVIGRIYVCDKLDLVLKHNDLVPYRTFVNNDNYTNSNFLAIPLVLYNVKLEDDIINDFKNNGLPELIDSIQQSFIDYIPYS